MWQQVAGGLFNSIFFGCSKTLMGYMDCIDLESPSKTINNEDPNLLRRLSDYTNNESPKCRKLHIQAAQCIEKSLNHSDWKEAMACVSSKNKSEECLLHIHRSKKNRHQFINSYLTNETMKLFENMELARQQCSGLRIKVINCLQNEGESPACLDLEVEYKVCLWSKFIGEQKPKKYLNCWNGSGNCGSLLNDIYDDLNKVTDIEPLNRPNGFKTFESYRNALYPVLVAGSYKKNP